MGVLQIGFSGGEPLLRNDLEACIECARTCGLYTNLITSAIGLSLERAKRLKSAGLDSIQISLQSDEAACADHIAGATAHDLKLRACQVVIENGIPLSLNVVLHRLNMDRVPQIIELARSLKAERLELANVQYYGWAYRNFSSLLPTREQVLRTEQFVNKEKHRLSGSMEIAYVLPDYFASRPKPCMNGWGRFYITVNPHGEVLPCPNARSIPGLLFETVRQKPLAEIWRNSHTFNLFRGTHWMPEPCRSCERREQDFGGCRCQAALLTGNAGNTDPVCEFSPYRYRIDELLNAVPARAMDFRQNPGSHFNV
jgi:pyrroloquinoline quinone biosynthesis protein E